MSDLWILGNSGPQGSLGVKYTQRRKMKMANILETQDICQFTSRVDPS